ncbi:alpha/beta fold hydrolase, partial [Legionella sp. CNM-1927-20]|uniref:alpha/beta fold hydrolase n=1 Tax=Legionella sp. CNM-1927-20 TaxID=3422221 RepID=UPI00403B17B3
MKTLILGRFILGYSGITFPCLIICYTIQILTKNFILTELFYDNQSVSLNYFEGPKNGAPILLLHGNMGHWQTFCPLIKELSKTRHVFAMDLRGHGKSSHVPNSYLLETHFQDVASFLRERINEPVTLL